METLEEIYEWIRGTHKGTDEIPAGLRWRTVMLLKDYDKRLTKLELVAKQLIKKRPK